jgi:hypothetical protein
MVKGRMCSGTCCGFRSRVSAISRILPRNSSQRRFPEIRRQSVPAAKAAREPFAEQARLSTAGSGFLGTFTHEFCLPRRIALEDNGRISLC